VVHLACVYLFKLPSWSRRIQVGFDWAWLLVFPRDLSCIKTDVTDRVTHAHYEAGDYVIKQGEPPTSFYVIEQGEVEIVRASPERPDGEVLAVLGAGNFFGEAALLSNQPRTASVRARSTAEIVVMGRHVFTSISQSLAPLKQALMAAITRRSPNSMMERPRVRAALREFQLADFVEPAPQPILPPTATLLEVTRLFGENEAPFFLVATDGETLVGLVTLTDLLHAQAANLPPETPLSDFMVKNPAVIAQGDSCLVAASAFREHGHKWLPVVRDQESRRIVGFMRARKLIARIMQVVGPPNTLTQPPMAEPPAGGQTQTPS
jgi:signal-transduction protein with cAMP-binding, CBS, and nucleotidyltransferase domain